MRAKRDPEQARAYHLMREYGITIAQYDALFKKQKGKCWICGRPPKTRRLNVDHCHICSAVRGLLCFRCNKGLQHFNDNPERFERAALYLRTLHAICNPKK